MKPRLRTEAEGRMVVPEVTDKEGLLILDSCLGRPMTRNSVLEGLSVSKLADIHSEIC